MTGYRLPASVQKQVWVNDRTVDVGAAVAFDAHDAMLGLDHRAFAKVSQQVFGRGHDYDELAIDGAALDGWVESGKDHTFLVTVDDHDLEAWLDGFGVTEEEAKSATPDLIDLIRSRAAAPAP